MTSNEIFELRTYDLKPEHFLEYLQLSNERYHLRTKHSKLVGYWLTEIGGQNQVVHLWQYDSLEHRKEVRDAMSRDEDWPKLYLNIIRPWLVRQDNVLLRVDGNSDLLHRNSEETETGFFYHLVATNGSSTQQEAGDDVELVAKFNCVLAGVQGTQYTLQRSKSLTKLCNSPTAAVNSTADRGKLLYPAPWAQKYGATLM